MTVYVDDMYRSPMGQYGRMKMSHMAATTTQELLEMADNIGLEHHWIQDKGKWNEHFDVSMSKRKQAIRHGAVEVTQRELAKLLIKKL